MDKAKLEDHRQELAEFIERWLEENNILDQNNETLEVSLTVKKQPTVEIVSNPVEVQSIPQDELDELASARVADIFDLNVFRTSSLRHYISQLYTVGNLIRKTEKDILRVRGVGYVAIDQLKQQLRELGLGLEMKVPKRSKEIEVIMNARTEELFCSPFHIGLSPPENCFCLYYPTVRDLTMVTSEELEEFLYSHCCDHLTDEEDRHAQCKRVTGKIREKLRPLGLSLPTSK